ncbi:MAG: magnesium/cobalt transporter CorA [Bacteroidia bacterium]|nr:magnesium/cobalt transporter CorA [Bacteroidia bacterium]NNM21947.1 magnesium/cobalt transporter CorA [Flavobacteriaceae bacterium]
MSKRRAKIGLAPGSVVFTGNRKVEKVLIHYMQYDSQRFSEKTLDSHAKTVLHESPDEKVDWYDIRGMHDTELIELFGESFHIHPLVLESIADTHQRPKFDEHRTGLFIIVRALSFNKETLECSKEHVAVYFNKGFVASFQETESDLFSFVRERIRGGKTRIRQRGSDYLAYALIDAIVDNYYVVLEEMEEVIEGLDEEMMDDPTMENKTKIHQLKKQLMKLRKSVAPLREAIAGFSKSDSEFIEDQNYVFLRDLYEHTVQVTDAIDSYRDLMNGLQELFISEVSFRMNKVMQLLTLISVIFIPLTFLAGIYGMNFEYIPELKYHNAYFILLGAMVVIAGVLLWLFKRKHWL